jgi:pimeloyl-ACP methyl ester carboxylesterase
MPHMHTPSGLTSSFALVLGQKLETLHIRAIEGHDHLAPWVFLHEGLGSVAMWRTREAYWPEQLCAATGRAGWVFSRRGYGQSEPIPDVRGTGRHAPDYMHREAFEVLPALLQALQIKRPLLLGHSDGASIALLYASRFAPMGCVALAPHVMVEDICIESITQAREAFLQGNLRERLAKYHADVDCAFWQWNDIWLSPAFRSFDIRAACAGISAPLLLVQGLQDPYGSVAQVDEVAARVAQAQVLKLDRCGHNPHKEHSAQVLQHIAAWSRALN